jgi:hypothetical protein
MKDDDLTEKEFKERLTLPGFLIYLPFQKNNTPMKKSFLFSLALLAFIGLQAQQIQNVTAAQQGKIVCLRTL